MYLIADFSGAYNQSGTNGVSAADIVNKTYEREDE